MKVRRNSPPKTTRKKASVTETLIKEDCMEGESKRLRYSVISCELRSALAACREKRAYIQLFEEQALTQGVYRKVVGMLAASTVLQCLDAGKSIPVINKTFFDRCWSAIDYKRTGLDKSNEITPYLDRMIVETGFDMTTLPPPVPFEMRQPTTKEMETVAINHTIINLEKRFASYATWRIANSPSATKADAQTIRDLAQKVVRRAMQGLSEFETGFHTGAIISVTELNEILAELGHVLKPLIPSGKQKSKTVSFRKNVHLLLPLLHRISHTFEVVHAERHEIAQSVEDRKALEAAYASKRLLMPGRPFALMPDWKLKAASVDYASTQLETLFGKALCAMQTWQDTIFDLTRFRKIPKSWRMMGFRTNGVELQVRWGALASRRPEAPNSSSLNDAGYDIPLPPRHVDATRQERGLYKISEGRYDNKLIRNEDLNTIRAIVVDPGIVKSVCVREVTLAKSAEEMKEDSYTWDVTSQEWAEMSDARLKRAFEHQRRRGRRNYARFLEALRHTRKRTVQLSVYHQYVKMFLAHLRPLSRELTSRRRRITKWVSKKKLQRALDSLADRLALGRKGTCSGSDPVKRVVFFGDGSFTPKRRHVSPPRKKLVKYISHRALTFVLSERGTSKYCPLSGHKMLDEPGSYRLRRCSCDLTGKDQCHYATKLVDRDDCATLSMSLCASWALQSHNRPIQYCC